MGALGDYIHFERRNYETYGTTMRGSEIDKYKSIRKTINNKINKISSISSSTLNKIKERIEENSYMNVEKEKGKIAKRIDNRLDTVYEYVAKISSSEAIEEYLRKGYSDNKFGYSKEKDYLISNIATKEEILNRIDKSIEIIQKTNIIDEKQAMELLHLYEIFYNKKLNLVGGEDIKTIIGIITDERNEITFNKTLSSVAGAFGEAMVAAIGDLAYEKVNNELEEIIWQSIKGTDRSSWKLKPSLISKNFIDNEGKKSVFKLNKTQDKVDVSIEIDTEQIDASVKNYSDNCAKPHLQNVNLFYTLAYLNQFNNFGNHWLNMHALNISGEDRNDMDEVLNKEVAYEALVEGNPLKKNNSKANTFIYINRKLGKVEAVNTKDILNTMDKIRISPEISNLSIRNNFEKSGVAARINNILHQIHETKLSVSYYTNWQ